MGDGAVLATGVGPLKDDEHLVLVLSPHRLLDRVQTLAERLKAPLRLLLAALEALGRSRVELREIDLLARLHAISLHHISFGSASPKLPGVYRHSLRPRPSPIEQDSIRGFLRRREDYRSTGQSRSAGVARDLLNKNSRAGSLY